MTPAMRASRLLGWVSFAVGAAELLAPKRVARAVGMNEDQALLVRACGLRQVATGVGAHSVYPVPALWARMGGDLADAAILGAAARRAEGDRGKGPWIAMAAVGGLAVLSAVVASRLAGETAEGKNEGARRDYSGRSGFPGGVESARGAGVVKDAMAGKAGGAAAGDVSAAGEAQTGRSSTDLAGAPAEAQRPAGPVGGSGGEGASGQAQAGSSSQSGGVIGGGQTMPKESQEVIPEPPSYTPA
jgi:hypothetical protein